jgi:hypothetical protein
MIRGKHGDTKPKEVTLRRGAGVIDLTGATGVSFLMRLRSTGAVTTGACTLVTPLTSGKVQFPLPATIGRYDIAWRITDAAGKTETVPGALPDVLLVTARPDEP